MNGRCDRAALMNLELAGSRNASLRCECAFRKWGGWRCDTWTTCTSACFPKGSETIFQWWRGKSDPWQDKDGPCNPFATNTWCSVQMQKARLLARIRWRSCISAAKGLPELLLQSAQTGSGPLCRLSFAGRFVLVSWSLKTMLHWDFATGPVGLLHHKVHTPTAHRERNRER